MLRELRMRFGRFHLGYAWAVLEPILMLSVLCAIRVAFGREGISGMAFPVFFASGIIPYFFFQSSITQSLGTIEANLSLFNYRPVRPFDGVFARLVLDFLLAFITGAILLIALYEIGYTYIVRAPLEMAAVIALLFGFTLGIALMTSLAGALFQETKKIVPLFMRPLFFLSGVFFPLSRVPEAFQQFLMLNPIAHYLELFRRALSAEYVSTMGDWLYASLWSLGALYLGMAMIRLNEQRVMTSGNIK